MNVYQRVRHFIVSLEGIRILQTVTFEYSHENDETIEPTEHYTGAFGCET